MSNLLSSASLIDQDGKSVNASSLAGKVIVLYFSAGWCGPCRQFTPVLKMFHHLAEQAGDHIQIVFCSNDKTEEDMMSYFKEHHGNWLAIKYGDSMILDLCDKVGVKGIPHLAVVDHSGTQVVSEGRKEVVEALRSQQIEETITRWRKLAGDWTAGASEATGGARIASTDVNAMREARLRALEARSQTYPAPKPTTTTTTTPTPKASTSGPSSRTPIAEAITPAAKGNTAITTPSSGKLPPTSASRGSSHPQQQMTASVATPAHHQLQHGAATPHSTGGGLGLVTPSPTPGLAVHTPMPPNVGSGGGEGEDGEDDGALMQLALAMSLGQLEDQGDAKNTE